MKTTSKKNSSGYKVIQPYVNYLIGDIAAAEREGGNNCVAISSEEDFVKHFLEIEKFAEEPMQTFGQLCGMKREEFPPADKLSIRQMQQINKAFHKLLETWNCMAIIPEKFPVTSHYRLLLSLLDEKMHVMNGGTMCFDFCTGESEGCALGDFCSCRKLKK